MVTFQAATALRGAWVTDAQNVRQLFESHCFGMVKWEVTDDAPRVTEMVRFMVSPSR